VAAKRLTPPQKFRVQKSAGRVLASILGIKTASSSFTICQKVNYQRGVLIISAGAIEGLLKENAAGRSLN
jgi:hypothetical protein